MTQKKRINIGIGDKLHAKAKVVAVLKDISLNEYLVSIIKSAVGDGNVVLGEKEKE